MFIPCCKDTANPIEPNLDSINPSSDHYDSTDGDTDVYTHRCCNLHTICNGKTAYPYAYSYTNPA